MILFARALLFVLCALALPASAEQTSRIIVKFKEGSAKALMTREARSARLAEETGVAMAPLRTLAIGADVVALDHPVDTGVARTLAAKIAARPDVEYAEPDYRAHAMRVANDEFFPAQAYLYNNAAGIGALPAWDITQGSPSVVVAVLDTGVLPNVDLAGRVLPGYDMISDPFVANDGDGRDADPSDPGDWLLAGENTGDHADCTVSSSSWHGTSVAGVIAADANNHVWTTGIDWYAKILPVRVLGKCGGYTSDIVDGIAWAGGLPVPGVPSNANPAQVINLSLGGDHDCSQVEMAAIGAVYLHGATRAVVVAAGNESEDVAQSAPANCPGVIAVASTTSLGDLAQYSNFGSGITISAPGGQYNPRLSTQGIVTLFNTGVTTPDTDTYGVRGGTSLAAPMVSGIVSLMLSLAPDLSAQQVRDILVSNAKPFPATSTCNTQTCGAGIANAWYAVQATAAIAPPRDTVVVAEYYNASLDHYFITWVDAEQQNLDAGNTPTQWVRTGYAFNTYKAATSASSPVCRYYIPPALGDSHFFGRGTTECTNTGLRNPTFVLEDPAFIQMVLPVSGNCPAGTVPIYRVFSNRADANHRYMTDPAMRDQMVAKGWVAEGDGPDLVVMCAPH